MNDENIRDKSPKSALARRILLDGQAPNTMAGDRARWMLEDLGLWSDGKPTPKGQEAAHELRAEQRRAALGF